MAPIPARVRLRHCSNDMEVSIAYSDIEFAVHNSFGLP